MLPPRSDTDELADLLQAPMPTLRGWTAVPPVPADAPVRCWPANRPIDLWPATDRLATLPTQGKTAHAGKSS